MTEASETLNLRIPSLGSEYERALDEGEATTIKRLLIGYGEAVHDYLLADFAGFMASRMTDDEDEYPELTPDEYVQQIGERAATYALRLRSYAVKEVWPSDVTPPGYVYALMEDWFVYCDQSDKKFAGLPIKEYLLADQFWVRQDG